MLRAAMVAGLLAAAGTATAAARPAIPGSPASLPVASFFIAPPFQRLFDDLLRSSATLRSQYDRILSAPGVSVRVEPMLARPADRMAQTEFIRSASGALEARVSIVTPLRMTEYAEMLAHEFEHILEQVEGMDLDSAAGQGSRGVSRLTDGVYETERARRAGREAAAEVERAR